MFMTALRLVWFDLGLSLGKEIAFAQTNSIFGRGTMTQSNHPVILCGGSGTGLWTL